MQPLRSRQAGGGRFQTAVSVRNEAISMIAERCPRFVQDKRSAVPLNALDLDTAKRLSAAKTLNAFSRATATSGRGRADKHLVRSG